ncbi:MAG: hypothetical protein GXO32_07985, partial [Crenarchaeota archaeon]|nr:hypothetical protein [Thermoproteota archaeon]
MSRVRLRYPILVNYAASLYRVLAAVAFAIIVVRKLGVYQFGIWTIAFSLSSFFAFPATTWLYWMSRFLARGYSESLATGGVITGAYAALASALYIATAWLVSLRVGGFSYLA